MTPDELQAPCEKHEDEHFLNFEEINTPRSKRQDLHAFLLLAELVPDIADIVVHADASDCLGLGRDNYASVFLSWSRLSDVRRFVSNLRTLEEMRAVCEAQLLHTRNPRKEWIPQG